MPVAGRRFDLRITGAGAQRLEAMWIGAGPGDAPTLIFLHEGLGCVSTWRDFPARVAAATGLGALVTSRRGYGASDPVPPSARPVHYMHDEAYDVLPALLADAGVRDAILVGHSDGASIALLYAGRAGVAAQEASAATPRLAPRLLGVAALAPHVFVEDLALASVARAAGAYRTTNLRARLARHHGGNVDGAFWGWNGAWLAPAFRAWSIEAEVSAVDAPVLVVQGRDDEYGTLAQVDAIQRRALGRVDACVLPRCGHSPQRDQEEATLAAITAFATSLRARRGP